MLGPTWQPYTATMMQSDLLSPTWGKPICEKRATVSQARSMAFNST